MRRVRRGPALVFAGMLVVSVAAKLALGAEAGRGNFDIQSYLLTGGALRDDPLNLYALGVRWPYPPGFLPWLAVATSDSTTSVLSFEVALRLPMVLADGAIAWLAQDFLRRRGAGERDRLHGKTVKNRFSTLCRCDQAPKAISGHVR